MTTPRPPFQFTLDLPIPGRDEAPRPAVREVEVTAAMSEPESPAPNANLMQVICDPDNIEAAARAVVRNKRGPASTISPSNNFRPPQPFRTRPATLACYRQL
jgi:hypothetical protein